MVVEIVEINQEEDGAVLCNMTRTSHMGLFNFFLTGSLTYSSYTI